PQGRARHGPRRHRPFCRTHRAHGRRRRRPHGRAVPVRTDPQQPVTKGTMMQRRIFAATAVSSLLLLAACAPSSDAPDPDDQDAGSEQTADGGECAEDVSLRVWSWRTEDADAYETIFDVFEEQNPCITVDFQAFVNTEYNQILQTGLTGSDGPDVAQVRSYGLLQPLVEGGNLVALDDIVPEVSEFDETILAGALGREDGQTYGVPFASQTLQMYYNTAIFEEH